MWKIQNWQILHDIWVTKTWTDWDKFPIRTYIFFWKFNTQVVTSLQLWPLSALFILNRTCCRPRLAPSRDRCSTSSTKNPPNKNLAEGMRTWLDTFVSRTWVFDCNYRITAISTWKMVQKYSARTGHDINAGLRIKLFAPGAFKSALDQKLPLSADSIWMRSLSSALMLRRGSDFS